MKKHKSLILQIVLFSFSFQSLLPAFSLDPNTLPSGYSSVNGNVQFNQTPNTLNVSTASNNAIAEYNNFSIGKDSSVNFSLPSSNSAILNRVTGNTTSQIFGSLSSNGRVFLINPNGIIFGSSSIVNVNSLMASTLNLSNQNFLAENYAFKSEGKMNSI
jgi:filamentous hemagglutinin family protein